MQGGSTLVTYEILLWINCYLTNILVSNTNIIESSTPSNVLLKHLEISLWFLAILFRPFGLLIPKTFKLFGFTIFRFWAYLMKVIPVTYLMKVILSLPDEGYSRNASCALNLISTFLLLLGVILSWLLIYY